MNGPKNAPTRDPASGTFSTTSNERVAVARPQEDVLQQAVRAVLELGAKGCGQQLGRRLDADEVGEERDRLIVGDADRDPAGRGAAARMSSSPAPSGRPR